MIAVDEINASATAGTGGKGAAKMDGVATAGADGQKGAQAEAYGVYADNGAVITLSAKLTAAPPVARSLSALRRIMRQGQKPTQCMPITQQCCLTIMPY